MKLKKWQIFVIIMLVINIIGRVILRLSDSFCNFYAENIHVEIARIFARISGIFSFSVIEFLLYFAALSLLITIIIIILRAVKRKYNKNTAENEIENESAKSGSLAGDFRRLCIVLLCVGLSAAAVYMFNSEINYNRRPFSEEAGIITTEYSKEELRETIIYVLDIINDNLPYVERKELNEHINEFKPTADLEDTARKAMKQLSAEYPCLDTYYPNPKGVITSEFWLSRGMISGVYSPFTLEANFNGDMPSINKPFTVCHELSHLAGFMREDEANFIAFLACIKSGNADFAYSGAFGALEYLLNAYEGVATDEEITAIYQLIPIEVIMDMSVDNEYWYKYRQTVTKKVYHTINDTGLKINGQEDGVRSYGRMVDLLIAYQKTEAEKRSCYATTEDRLRTARLSVNRTIFLNVRAGEGARPYGLHHKI
ncbi:MAG: DUF3810 domain-containing protein [Ruminococcus sp.]|nr:DUF3810 domain-containing protein [Ruminococcus sp.]